VPTRPEAGLTVPPEDLTAGLTFPGEVGKSASQGGLLCIRA
jgi:hypothetical protein